MGMDTPGDVRYHSVRIVLRIIDGIVGLVELALALRLLLRFFGANPGTPFVSWIYDITSGLLAPFANMFPAPTLAGGYVLEFSTIFAMLLYALAGWLIMRLITLLARALFQPTLRADTL